jgi:hypothetical protein
MVSGSKTQLATAAVSRAAVGLAAQEQQQHHGQAAKGTCGRRSSSRMRQMLLVRVQQQLHPSGHAATALARASLPHDSSCSTQLQQLQQQRMCTLLAQLIALGLLVNAKALQPQPQDVTEGPGVCCCCVGRCTSWLVVSSHQRAMRQAVGCMYVLV